MEPITDIVIHLSGNEVEKVSTTRFIRIKEIHGLTTQDRLTQAIRALESIMQEYNEADERK
jgi:hypothetical protein